MPSLQTRNPRRAAHERALYRALLARDYRFDGRFFIGVKTTGIYCRPICPARPLQKNITFFDTAFRAEREGYRPCMRCRPEAAPQSAAWQGQSAMVARALRELTVEGASSETFAARFGVSARHLNRVFRREIGKTPKQLRDLNRLGFARKLVVETQLPLTEIAQNSGFRSLRRFNDAFKTAFGKPPSAFRKGSSRLSDTSVTLRLSVRPPFDWSTLLDFYLAHPLPGIDRVINLPGRSQEIRAYERTFRIRGICGSFRATFHAQPPEVHVHVRTPGQSPAPILLEVCQRVRKMFDLDSDPLLIAEHFQNLPTINRLFRKHPGLRLTRGWDPFEAAICTILGQLVSLSQARALVGSLIEHYGERDGDILHFPTPKKIAESDLIQLRTTGARRRTLIELARRVHSRQLDLTRATAAELLQIPGIGPWSAEYIQLRALGNPDAFPKTDLILKRALEEVPELKDLDLAHASPWRGYVAITLWKEYAHKLTRKKKDKTQP